MAELDSNVPLPDEKPKIKRTRARNNAVKAAEKAKPGANLLAALKVISPAQRKSGVAGETFCWIRDDWIAANNGVLFIAAPIGESTGLDIRPNTLQLVEALKKCTDALNVAQLHEGSLSVQSDKFRALIECVPADALAFPGPDDNVANVGNEIKTALEAASTFATEGAPNPVHASTCLQANSAVSTNGHCIIEAWHGANLPTMLIPRASALAVARHPRDLVGFGYGGSSATFWFADGSFIKTQLYNANFPAYSQLFDGALGGEWQEKIPEEFFKAVSIAATFSKDGHVFFTKEGIVSSRSEDKGAQYALTKLPEGMGFKAAYLLAVKDYADTVEFANESSNLFFYRANVRGIIRGLGRKEEAPPREVAAGSMDDDIPF